MVQLYTASVTVRREKKPLRRKLSALLAYYMKYGYNKYSKDLAATSMGVKTTNLNVMNHELTKLGYLIPSTKNFLILFSAQKLDSIFLIKLSAPTPIGLINS